MKAYRKGFFVLSTLVVAACSASSEHGVGVPDAATGGTAGTGGASSGGASNGGASNGGAPSTGGSTAVPTGGASGDAGPLVNGCTALCVTIATAGCPNGPALLACVENCVGIASSCRAAQECFACSGTSPRITCTDAGVPVVPDCPTCNELSALCTAQDASVTDASVPDASIDASADANDSGRPGADSGARDGAVHDGAADARKDPHK